MTGTRRAFTREPKGGAARPVTDRGLGFTEAAREPGIAGGLPRERERALEAEAGQARPGRGDRTPAEEEVHRLRAEVERLRAEGGTLKRAAASFAADPP